jgi:ferritin
MIITKPMNAALNEQVGNELLASNQYLAIAAYFDHEGLPTLSKHFFKQSAEERDHALRFVKYILEAGGALKIPAVPAPRTSFKSAADAVALALESELKVTKQINEIVDLAIKDHDHLSKNALEWFVNEQREEVSSMDTLLRMVKRAGEPGLFFVENFLLQGGLAEEGADKGKGD